MVRPRYVLVENTPGLLSLGWQDILADLAEGGFDAEWQTFPAAALGAPHRRERVFIVAYSECDSRGRVFQGTIPEVTFWGTPDESSRSGVPRIWDQEIERGLRDANGVAYGFPQSVATRLPGNAVVPQVAEWIGRRILEHEQIRKHSPTR